MFLDYQVFYFIFKKFHQMVSKMFTALRNTYETSKTLNKANGRFVTMKPRTPTVAARFHDSLQQLLESMSK